MNVNEIVKIIENSGAPDYPVKDWRYQPDYFKHVLKDININSLFMELGVFSGHTLQMINNNTKDHVVYGFDTFSGLPEDWKTEKDELIFSKDHFNTNVPNDTEKNKFIVGKIEDTLEKFLLEKNQKIKFAHVDLDLYSSSKNAFDIIFNWLEDEAVLIIDDVHNYPGWEHHSIKAFSDSFDEKKYRFETIATCGWESGWSSMALKIIRRNIKKEVVMVDDNEINKDITIVTGLWDLERENLQGWAHREFSYYKEKFFEMLATNVQMCIWIPSSLREEVEKIREGKPTKIFIKENKDFETWNPFFDKIQEIRQDENWLSQAGWLRESPQAALRYYNAMMFTKMFMVNDSAVLNPFNSKYFFWIDGGLTNTVGSGYFHQDKVLNNLENYMVSNHAEFMNITYPYTGNTEIHGFERNAMAKHCRTDFVNYVARGGFFGGEKEAIHKINESYYATLNSTLQQNLMGADECIFTILCHQNPETIHRFEVEGNGLVWPFFEELKKYTQVVPKPKTNGVGLYVITFNSPKQFETLLKSMVSYDENFLKKTKKFLLDNSTDLSTTPRYLELCEEYGFEHIKKDNIGITGGRQWVAEHFNEQKDLSHYFFFEDDMFFVDTQDYVCKTGFNRYIDDLFNKCLEIIKKEKFDFLKLNFSEFYGTNEKQWAWYNVPQSVRQERWPNYCKLPEHGFDPNSPCLKFENIKSHDGVPYATGEIYICNWPIVLSKEGNYNCYLKTKYAHPFEQTIMSHCYQELLKENIRAAVLLATPTEHERFDFYAANLRKEC